MMRLPRFEYRVPTRVDEAVRMMADAGPETNFVAGGTDLYPNMKRRQQTPRTVISIMRIREMHEIRGDGGSGVIIGAGVVLREVAANALIQANHPAVARAAVLIATPLLRNMGTIGGNLLLDTRCNYYDQNFEWRKGVNFCLKKDGDVCWVAPGSTKCWAVQSSDLAPVMVAVGAKLKLISAVGERMIEARDLYNDDGINYLHKRPDELLTEIHLPSRERMQSTYHKLRRRGSFDFPVLGVAASVEVNTDGSIENARVVLGGVAPAPIEVKEASSLLAGAPLDDERIASAAEACYDKARPLDNTDFVMGWRKQMARVYAVRALEELREASKL
ncbi:MAG TPA: xanthine dehydrogenase family protein subunit M [Blastocatellia bacterium]|nr:xanthine dehydrogenase family protein subunit M [Blastocatellia bacterium]